MKKIIMSTLLICGAFQLNYGMDTVTFASFKDAVLGKKRNIEEEIKSAEADTRLTPSARNKKLGELYRELCNKHRGTAGYDEYNVRMCNHLETARILEIKEQCETKEAELLEKIDEIQLTTTPQEANLKSYDAIIAQYTALKELFEESDTEKYDLYDAHLNSWIGKKNYEGLQVALTKETDKSKKAQYLRQMAELRSKKEKAEKLNAEADALEKEVKYDELRQKAESTTNLSQKAELHRIMMYYSEKHAEENLALAKQFEEQAEQEHQKQLIIVDKTCKIVGLKMEIALVNANKDKKLTPYNRLKTLAQLLEQGSQLAQDIPKFKEEFADASDRIPKLRREAIAYASNDAERKEMIGLLQY